MGIDDITIELLIDGVNANPHTFSMSIVDLKKISSADVIIMNGKAEEFLAIEKMKEVNPRAKIVLTQQASVQTEDLPEVDSNNPHTWLSPKRAILECEAIGKMLKENFPLYASIIEGNMEKFRKRLEMLSWKISSILGRAGTLEMITFHDALDIFAKDFGATILYHIQDTHGVPPSPRKLAEIVDTISSRNGKALLVSESPVPDEITSMISQKSGAPIIWFDPIIAGDKGLNRYETSMIRNVEILVSSVTM